MHTTGSQDVKHLNKAQIKGQGQLLGTNGIAIRSKKLLQVVAPGIVFSYTDTTSDKKL